MTDAAADRKARDNAFGQLIREIREQTGQTQEALAFASDLERSTISIIERGRSTPTLNTLFLLARGLKTTPTALIQAWESRIPTESDSEPTEGLDL